MIVFYILHVFYTLNEGDIVRKPTFVTFEEQYSLIWFHYFFKIIYSFAFITTVMKVI